MLSFNSQPKAYRRAIDAEPVGLRLTVKRDALESVLTPQVLRHRLPNSSIFAEAVSHSAYRLNRFGFFANLLAKGTDMDVDRSLQNQSVFS